MPKTVDPERFVQLLRGYLTKSGRKQAELARASHVTESMLSKVLKGKAQPNLGEFLQIPGGLSWWRTAASPRPAR